MSVWQAVTAASHLALIFAVALLLIEVVTLLRRPEAMLRVTLGPSPRIGLYAVGLAVVVERAYYVGARMTAHRGTDLWELHPVPELLSGMFAATVFFAWALIVTDALGGWARARWTIGLYGGFLAALWLTVVATMRVVA